MGLFIRITTALMTLILPGSILGEDEDQLRQINYLIHHGEVDLAIDYYQAWYESHREHQFEVLQNIGLGLLRQGWQTHDPEIQLLTLFGAGISQHDKTLEILIEGLQSHIPQLQLVSLNFLAQRHHDEADKALNMALQSPFLPIQLEAAFYLAQNHDDKGIHFAETLLYKLDPMIRPVFPKIFASAATPGATRILHRLLNDPSAEVRIEAINSVAQFGRDDFLPKLRRLAKQHHAAQQEACAFALGVLSDEEAFQILQKLSQSKIPNIQLAASYALIQLGSEEFKEIIKERALEGNIFAISLLGKCEGSEEFLFPFCQSQDLNIRLNASLALLERQDDRCLKGLEEILIRDAKDFAFVQTQTPGGTLHAWRVVPSASQNLKDHPLALELSTRMRETCLIKAIELSEPAFIHLMCKVFETYQAELIPMATTLLENKQSDVSIGLLNKFQHMLGAPLARYYCTLALYRLERPGEHYTTLLRWIAQKQHIDLIRFRPFVPLDKRHAKTPFDLTPEETSRLLIETFEAFANKHNDEGIFALINAIKHGNIKNRYALAGLLIRTIQ